MLIWPGQSQGGVIMRRCCTVALLMALAVPFGARCEEPARPLPADGKCQIPADGYWTRQERFVWERVCVGDLADFNKGDDYGGKLDPKDPNGLPASRILRPSFLETILLEHKYRRVLTRRGVRINGARFTESLELRNAVLGHELWLNRSLFEKDVDFDHLRSTRTITFDESKIAGLLKMVEAQVGEGISARDGEFANVNFSGAHVGQTLDLRGSKVTGTLNMSDLQVNQNLFMTNISTFAKVDLTAAHIGKMLILSGSKVAETLVMNWLYVGQALLMRDKAEFAEVQLGGAHISG